MVNHAAGVFPGDFLPFVGLLWGVLNLVRNRRDSGLLMTLATGVWLLYLFRDAIKVWLSQWLS